MGISHERAILSYLLVYPNSLGKVASLITPRHFLDPLAREVYAHMVDNPLDDPVEIKHALKNVDMLEIMRCEPPIEASLEPYCNIIIKDYLIYHSKEFLREAYEEIKDSNSIDSLAEKYEDQIRKLTADSHRNTPVDFGSKSIFDQFTSGIDSPPRKDLIPFYMPTISKYLGGIAPGSFVMLSGNAKDGKTTIGLRQTWYLAEQNIRSAFISLEQRTQELVETIVGQRSKVSGYEIRNKRWTGINKERVIQAAEYLRNCDMYILGADISSPETIFSNMRMLAENGVRWFTIDHLQLAVEMNFATNYTYQIKEFTRKVKLFCGQYGVVVFLIAQNQEDADRPKTWGSNVPQQDVDAWLVYSRGKKDKPGPPEDYISLYRNRLPGGETGKIQTTWNKDTNCTEELYD